MEAVSRGDRPLKRSKPIPRKRKRPRVIHPERSGSHHRVRLYGAARTQRRREIFERSGGFCEEIRPYETIPGETRCWEPITWDSMHWSHKLHAANKCDCLDCGLASCETCHRNKHNAGGKPCPKKPKAVAAAETELLGKGLVA